MEFQITNPGQVAIPTPFYIDPTKHDLKLYQDVATNANELTLTVARKPGENVPINQYARVVITDENETLFIGYVERYKNTKSDKTFYCKGIENLLYHRFLHKWNYAQALQFDGTMVEFTLGDLIKDHYTAGYPITPATKANCPGLLQVANGLMPWYMSFTVYDASKQIIKYTGWGTASRLGASPVLYYIDDRGVQPLTKVNALTDLQSTDIAYYIDATDLYIRHTTNTGAGNVSAVDYWYYSGRIIAENCFDTLMRIGDIDYDYAALVGFLKVDHTKPVGQTLFSVLKSFGLYTSVRYQDGYGYIDASATDQGRGKTTGLYQIAESECTVFEKSVPNKPACHEIRGYGPAEQVYTATAWAGNQGFWYGDLLGVDNGYWDTNGTLITNTYQELLNRNADYQFLLETARAIKARPGDYIQVVPDFDAPEILPIYAISRNEKGTVRLEMNNKTPKLTNAWQTAGVLGTTYSNYLVKPFGHIPVSASCNFYLRTFAMPACAAGSVSLACPDLTGWENPLVTLDVTITLVTGATIVLDPQRYIVMIGVNGVYNENSIIYNYAWGDSISDIDITNIVTPNAANTISVTVLYMGDIPGVSDCASSMGITANVTMNFENRLDLWG